jgi:siroheme synthase (precorrin-2 oxidase/ferrochelatase)
VIISAEYLGENAMVTKGMGEITQMIKEKIKEEIGKNSGEVFEKIEKMFGDDPDKIQRIQEALMTPDNPDSENREFWEKLKEEGIKYFVVEYLPLSILCFCEEIDVM